jgi:hypothetical protein
MKKIEGGKRHNLLSITFFFPPQLFWQKVFDFLAKSFCGVFELPLLRNAPKRQNKIRKIRNKVLTYPMQWLVAIALPDI